MGTTSPSYNITEPSEPTFNFTRFVVLQSAVTFFTIISAYITTALCYFEWTLGSKVYTTGQSFRTEKHGRYAIAMRCECIVASLFLFGRLICEEYELLTQYLGADYDYCDVILKLKVAMGSVAMTGVYLFLWTRQRLFYSEPAMHHLSPQLMKAMSWISLLLLVVGQIVVTTLFLVTRFYKLTHLGCSKYMSTIPDEVPWILVGTLTVCGQLILCFLFVFPLIKQKSAVASEQKVGFQKLLRVIKRVAIITSVCIATDLFSFLLILFARDNNNIVVTLAYDISLVSNVICMVASYSDWKLRLFALICCYRNTERPSSAVINYSKSETSKKGVFTVVDPN